MSSKMPKNNEEKTESEPSQKSTIIFLIVAAVLVLVIGALTFTFLPDKRVIINNQRLEVSVASSSQQRERGLSGTGHLGEKQGMLFVYSDAGQYCMWMKDMNYSLDMVWLNNDKKVVHIEEDATPESYPDKTFCSDADARYVLEVNAGMVKKLDLKLGDQARF